MVDVAVNGMKSETAENVWTKWKEHIFSWSSFTDLDTVSFRERELLQSTSPFSKIIKVRAPPGYKLIVRSL